MGHGNDEEVASEVSVNVESMEIAEDEDEEIEIPPLSSYVMAWRHWCKFAMWPAIFLLVNVIAFSTLLIFDRKEYRSFDSPKKLTAERIAKFQTNTAMVAIILFVDFVILLKAALFMEKEILALDTVEEDTRVAGYHMHHVHAQASRKMDSFFQKRGRPRVSFFISMLYVAAISCGAGFVSCIGLRGYSASRKMKRDCAIVGPRERQASKTNRPIDGLPSGLQEWARQWKIESDRSSQSFIRLNDGRVFFSGFEKTTNETDESTMDDYAIYDMNPEYHPTLISTAKDGGAIKNHRNVLDPRYLTSVKGNSETGSQSFCCAYSERNDIDKRGRSFRRDIARRLLCIVSGEDVSVGFRNISLPMRPKNNREMVHREREARVKAYNNVLYFEYTTFEHDYRTSQKIFAQMEIYKLDPDTMKLESVANVTGEENLGTIISGDGSGSVCNKWLNAIMTILASIVVFPASYWLLKEKQIPSGVSPVVVMFLDIISTLTNDDFAIALGMVVTIAASICLLGIVKVPTLVSREMLVWVYYAIICYCSVCGRKHQNDTRQELRYYGYNMHKHSQLQIPWWSFALFSSIIGVLLNHPVLQVLGWIGGTASVCYGLFGSLIGGRRSPYDVYDDDMIAEQNHLWMVPIGLVIGCGLVALGHALTKYRAYMVYYMKRLWRTTANVASAGQHRDEMTTGLLSR